MPRLFVGAFPPAEIALQLHERVRGPLSAVRVRLVPPEEIHLTLRFLGETPEPEIEKLRLDLARALAGRREAKLWIRGTGAFPDVERARVLWAGIEGTVPEVSTPHLTVARSPRPVRTPEAFLRAEFSLPWTLDEIRLVESRPGARGPERFRTIAAFRLSPESV